MTDIDTDSLAIFDALAQVLIGRNVASVTPALVVVVARTLLIEADGDKWKVLTLVQDFGVSLIEMIAAMLEAETGRTLQ